MGAGDTCQITSCPPPYELTSPPDTDTADGLTCRKPCGWGREFQDAGDGAVPLSGCYGTCATGSTAAAVVVSDRTLAVRPC